MKKPRDEKSAPTIEHAQKALYFGIKPPDIVQTEPPLTWKCWKKPSQALPIDDEIEQLIKNKKKGVAPFLALEKESIVGTSVQTPNGVVEKPKRHCPYFTVRYYTIMAIEFAKLAVVEENKIRLDHLKFTKIQDQAQGLAGSLKTFLKSIDGFSWNLLQRDRADSRTDYNEVNQRLKEFNDANNKIETGASGLEELSDFLNKELKRVPALPKNKFVWEQTFATKMLEAWLSLTNNYPKTPSPVIINFVQAVYTSLVKEEEIDWSFQIKKAIKSNKQRPEWDRFDRYVKLIDPPDTQYITKARLMLKKPKGMKILNLT